jgi:hypothetical protein
MDLNYYEKLLIELLNLSEKFKKIT